jgi:hypothetical protein
MKEWLELNMKTEWDLIDFYMTSLGFNYFLLLNLFIHKRNSFFYWKTVLYLLRLILQSL